jgi:hypothetical protein
MIKVNIDAGNDLVMIAKDDIRMITSTPEGVWLYYKSSENGILITSSNLEPAELFKKVAGAIAFPLNELHSTRNKSSMEKMASMHCYQPKNMFVYEPEPNRLYENKVSHHTKGIRDAVISFNVQLVGPHVGTDAAKELELINLINKTITDHSAATCEKKTTTGIQ